jgi:hypothetical protein
MVNRFVGGWIKTRIKLGIWVFILPGKIQNIYKDTAIEVSVIVPDGQKQTFVGEIIGDVNNASDYNTIDEYDYTKTTPVVHSFPPLALSSILISVFLAIRTSQLT